LVLNCNPSGRLEYAFILKAIVDGHILLGCTLPDKGCNGRKKSTREVLIFCLEEADRIFSKSRPDTRLTDMVKEVETGICRIQANSSTLENYYRCLVLKRPEDDSTQTFSDEVRHAALLLVCYIASEMHTVS
jgi:hypothetical protein